MKIKTASLDSSDNSGVAILNRVMRPSDAPLTAEAARPLLALRFQPQDERRMNRLATKARQGTLTEKERTESEQYNLVSHMLALLQAKARHVLPLDERDSGTA